MPERLPSAQLRKLKGLSQRLNASVKLGKQGLTEGFLKSLNEELERHELVKLKFDEFKEKKKELAPQIAEKTNSHIVMRVGNVLALYRQNPDPAKQKIKF